MFNRDLYLDFLAKKNKRPLFSCMWEPMINPSDEIIKLARENNLIHPEDVQPLHILNIARSVLKTLLDLKGDLPVALQASGGHQWLEAICGCKIMASNGQIWASNNGENTLDGFLNLPVSVEWEEKLISCHEEIVQFSKGICFAALPVLHGPIDILSAYLGTENLAYAFYDEPDKLKRAIKKAGDVFIRVGKKLVNALIPHEKGYCGRMYIYTKKPCITLQNDNSYLASPEMFKEYLEPVEQSIIKSFPSTVYHMHNTSLHLGNIVADYKMDAIQMSVDPGGIPLEKQIDVFEQMREKTPLILSCWSFEDMEFLRSNLTPQGLALTYIPEPDGCTINKDGAFDEFGLWQEMYDNWIESYSNKNMSSNI